MSPKDREFVADIAAEVCNLGVDYGYVQFTPKDVSTLLSIIRKQEKALERAKEQRDEWIADHCYEPDNKLQQVMTFEKLVELENKELDLILSAEGG